MNDNIHKIETNKRNSSIRLLLVVTNTIWKFVLINHSLLISLLSRMYQRTANTQKNGYQLNIKIVRTNKSMLIINETATDIHKLNDVSTHEKAIKAIRKSTEQQQGATIKSLIVCNLQVSCASSGIH